MLSILLRAELRIPVIANGNIQYLADVIRCFSETNANAVMSAEGHLHNPAIFVGSQPSVYSMCLEYLECAKTYPTNISIVRGHVFKLSHHALNEHPSFRQLIGLAQDIDELSDVIHQMQKTCSHCSINRDISLQYPHWICQPYERPKSEHSTAADRQSGAVPGNTSELSCTPKDLLSRKLILQEERRSRRDAKQNAKAAKRVAAKSKNSLCNRCQSNLRGVQCPSMACRSCCWMLDPERVSQCAAHLHDKRRRICEK
ncbi:tRNA-dihydrouridine synthase 1 [Paragonimus westermani]|uniref:tRNA-dihydrouridine synthase 1 n=1 Tax=Paragonimus westermani TaxID=34504 RepID=A0A5J4NXR6_9TREM|nr:tRNA-dihydrouridine synthase 1 [Paragonimus westermani]